MRQTQRPQTQVRGRVRDAAEKVLDGVNTLLDRNLAHVKLELSKEDHLAIRLTSTLKQHRPTGNMKYLTIKTTINA